MYICSAETPEGASVGVVKNLALSCHVTKYSDINLVINVLNNIPYIKNIENFNPVDLKNTYKNYY